MSIIKIEIYELPNGKSPYLGWLTDLDIKIQAIIEKRIARIRLGNFGDCETYPKWLGMWELRIDHGPGYRIYFGKKGFKRVILLLGGDKASQKRDITKALHYWQKCKESYE